MGVRDVTIMNEKCVNSMEYSIIKTIGCSAPFAGIGEDSYLFESLMGFLQLQCY